MARVAGPYDQYRNQKPPDIPQDKWDAYIDQENAKANGQSAGVSNLFGGNSQSDLLPRSPLNAPTMPSGIDQFTTSARNAVHKPVDPGSIARAGAVKQIADYTNEGIRWSDQGLAGLQGAADLGRQIDVNSIGELAAKQQNAAQGYRNVAGQVRRTANDYNALSDQLFGGYAQGMAGFNAQDQGTLDRYLSETNPLMQQLTARGSDPADIARQQQAYNLAANIAGGGLDYSAAQYQSNPADVARQQQMYGTMMGIGQGSLDYQAAQWRSNPADLARQNQMYSELYGVGKGQLDYQADNWRTNPMDVVRQDETYQDLRRVGQGALDYRSKAAQAYASPEALINQDRALGDIRNDLLNGSKDQREVMEKFKALSDPSVTGKERFLSELARREFESADKSSRDAVSENLAARGLRSGGQQIAMQQATRQQLAQDRLLKELGIQAQAVDRSMQALGGWGTAANSIRAGDQNALNMQSGLTTAMRNASFDEAYKRGLGADAASANNQAVRFGGMQSSAQQANAIRGANDQVGMFNTGQNNVAYANNQATRFGGMTAAANQSNAIRSANDQVGMFNTGQTNNAYANNQATRLSGYQGAATQSNAIRSSNDAVGTFNVGQTNIARANNQGTRLAGAGLQANQANAIRSANDSVRQFQDTFAQNEAQRVGGLAGQRAGIALGTTAQQSNRVQNLHDTGQGVISTNFGREQDANRADWDVITNDLGMGGDYFDAVTGAADRNFARTNTVLGTGSNIKANNTDSLIRRLGIEQLNRDLAFPGGYQ